MSFNFFDWCLIEKICAGDLNVSQLNNILVKRMLYNILPNGNTLLHQFCKNDQSDDLLEIFKLSCKKKKNYTDRNFNVPFLPNFLGESPFHISKQNQDYKSIDLVL